jgi:hypothetical protein
MDRIHSKPERKRKAYMVLAGTPEREGFEEDRDVVRRLMSKPILENLVVVWAGYVLAEGKED